MEDLFFARLRAALQSLAQPAAVQVALFPDFVCVTDELAQELSDAMLLLRPETQPALTEVQEELLAQLDELFEGAPEASWNIEALSSDPLWAQARNLARRALDAFSWPASVPDLSFNTYVRG